MTSCGLFATSVVSTFVVVAGQLSRVLIPPILIALRPTPDAPFCGWECRPSNSVENDLHYFHSFHHRPQRFRRVVFGRNVRD